MREAICIHIGQARACVSPESLAARSLDSSSQVNVEPIVTDSSKASEDQDEVGIVQTCREACRLETPAGSSSASSMASSRMVGAWKVDGGRPRME